MTDNIVKSYLRQFDDFVELKIKHDKIKKEYTSSRRKLKSLIEKYDFLTILVSIGSKDDDLENSFKEYVKSIGADKVELVGKKFKEEDLRILFADRLILVEVTGNNKLTQKDDKSLQVLKHIPKRQNANPNLKVSGLFVVNHDNEKHFTKRHKNPFDKRLKDLASANNICLVTTTQLLNEFIALKKNKLKPEDLLTKLSSPGLFENIG